MLCKFYWLRYNLHFNKIFKLLEPFITIVLDALKILRYSYATEYVTELLENIVYLDSGKI